MEYGRYVEQIKYLTVLLTRILGCTQLARIEENIVTAFTEVGGEDDNRLVTTLNRAYYVSTQNDLREL